VLNHFCDPDKNHIDLKPWPLHDACQDPECSCICHPPKHPNSLININPVNRHVTNLRETTT
jgi:hypothetical protein